MKESEQCIKDLQKKTKRLGSDLEGSKAAVILKVEELEIMVSDADTDRAELEAAKGQSSTLKIELDAYQAENATLRKQHLNNQSALLASRTNLEVEEDRTRKAVQGATSARDKTIRQMRHEIDYLKSENERLLGTSSVNANLIMELSRGQDEVVEKNEKNEKLSATGAVQETLESELTEERAKNLRLEEELALLRAGFQADWRTRDSVWLLRLRTLRELPEFRAHSCSALSLICICFQFQALSC